MPERFKNSEGGGGLFTLPPFPSLYALASSYPSHAYCLGLVYMYYMVLILDGNSKIGAHARSNLCYLIESSYKSDMFSPKKPILPKIEKREN